MNCDNINVGELLVKLCKLSRLSNVNISIMQSPLHPSMFEIRLNRKNHHALGTIDVTRMFRGEPERAAEFVFDRALYDINQLDSRDVMLGDLKMEGDDTDETW